MSEYTRIAERATHTLVPCIACRQAAWIVKYGWRGAVLPTIGCTCVPNDPDINYAATPDLLALAERVVKTFGPNTVCFASLAEQAKAAIAKARGAV